MVLVQNLTFFNLLKARVQEISVVDKLKYLHCLLVYVLPVLKGIYSDQCFEIGVETRSSGAPLPLLSSIVLFSSEI